MENNPFGIQITERQRMIGVTPITCGQQVQNDQSEGEPGSPGDPVSYVITLENRPETNSLHLKINGWKMRPSFLGFYGYFQGRAAKLHESWMYQKQWWHPAVPTCLSICQDFAFDDPPPFICWASSSVADTLWAFSPFLKSAALQMCLQLVRTLAPKWLRPIMAKLWRQVGPCRLKPTKMKPCVGLGDSPWWQLVKQAWGSWWQLVKQAWWNTPVSDSNSEGASTLALVASAHLAWRLANQALLGQILAPSWVEPSNVGGRHGSLVGKRSPST